MTGFGVDVMGETTTATIEGSVIQHLLVPNGASQLAGTGLLVRVGADATVSTSVFRGHARTGVFVGQASLTIDRSFVDGSADVR